MYYNKRCKTFCIVINNALSIVIKENDNFQITVKEMKIFKLQ